MSLCPDHNMCDLLRVLDCGCQTPYAFSSRLMRSDRFFPESALWHLRRRNRLSHSNNRVRHRGHTRTLQSDPNNFSAQGAWDNWPPKTSPANLARSGRLRLCRLPISEKSDEEVRVQLLGVLLLSPLSQFRSNRAMILEELYQVSTLAPTAILTRLCEWEITYPNE
jgi:hypothetical protein